MTFYNVISQTVLDLYTDISINDFVNVNAKDLPKSLLFFLYNNRQIKKYSMSYQMILDYFYREKLDTIFNTLNKNNINPTTLSDILSKRFYHIIVYSSDDKWYFFDGVKWIVDPRSNLTQKAITMYLKKYIFLDNNTLYELFRGILSRIMNELKILLYYHEFLDLLNNDPNLLCCSNGIFDCKNEIFRRALPSDFCSYSTGLYYSPHISTEDSNFIHSFYTSIFNDVSIAISFLLNVARCLEGGNKDKKVYCLSGERGFNAKTTIFNFIWQTLGSYYFSAPVSFITSLSNDSTKTTPVLKAILCKRIFMIPEVPPGQKLIGSTIKLISGRDLIYVRGLYEEAYNKMMQPTLFMTFNISPTIDNEDLPLNLRFLVYNTNVQFLTNEQISRLPKHKNFNITKADVNMGEKLIGYVKPHLSLFIRYFLLIKGKSIPIPAKVLSDTDKILNDSNPIYKFYNEHLTTAGATDGVDIYTIYNNFRTWFYNNYPSRKIMTKEKFERGLGMLCPIIDNTVLGITLRWGDIDNVLYNENDNSNNYDNEF
jgi:phage/plasmid-associated DNA primase